VVIIITPHIVDIRNPEDRGRLEKQAEEWRNNGNNMKEQKKNEK
jgi:hypothetical protein